MKTIAKISMVALLLSLAVTSCKKENDFGGKAKIEGTVTLKGAPVQDAIVYIAFDATERKTDYSARTITDASGKYVFNALHTGNYYVTAEFTNDANVKFTSGGALVTIGDKKGTVKADLVLE